MCRTSFFFLNTDLPPTYTLDGLETHKPLLAGGVLRFTFQVIQCSDLLSSPYNLQGFTQDPMSLPLSLRCVGCFPCVLGFLFGGGGGQGVTYVWLLYSDDHLGSV